jgi:glutamyl-tRNA synthetase
MLIDSRNDDSLIESSRSTADLVSMMSSHFELDRISLGGPVFDMSKLNWLNGQHIRRHSVEEFMRILLDWGFEWPHAIPEEQREHIVRVAQPRVETLADFGPLVAFFADRPDLSKSDLALPKLSEEQAQQALIAAEQQLLQLPDDPAAWNQAAIGERLKNAAAEGGWKFKDVARLFYIAITGSPTSVPLFDAMEILGKVESLRRLRIALETLR